MTGGYIDVSMSSLFKRHGDKLVEQKPSFTHSPLVSSPRDSTEANRSGTPQGTNRFAVSNLSGGTHI